MKNSLNIEREKSLAILEIFVLVRFNSNPEWDGGSGPKGLGKKKLRGQKVDSTIINTLIYTKAYSHLIVEGE